MLRKRLIFTLLYNQGNFVLSRNFRLQTVGNLDWLLKNYHFLEISKSIDELILLDISRSNRDKKKFLEAIRVVSAGIFVPISAGGDVVTPEDVNALLQAGCDKVVVNSILFDNPEILSDLAAKFGEQCLIASLDLKRNQFGNYEVWSKQASKLVELSAKNWLNKSSEMPFGELYLNSIDKDGTGQGYELEMLNHLPPNFVKPIILAGGAGNSVHLKEGLSNSKVSAVATANLMNFIGDGLERARTELILGGTPLPTWNISGSIFPSGI
jgi:cyclase